MDNNKISPNHVLSLKDSKEIFFHSSLANLYTEYVSTNRIKPAFIARHIFKTEIAPFAEEDYDPLHLNNFKSKLTKVLTDSKLYHISFIISKMASKSFYDIKQYLANQNNLGDNPKKKRRRLNNQSEDNII